MAVDVKVRMGGITRSICPCFRLCCSILIPLLPTPRRCLTMEASVQTALLQVDCLFRYDYARAPSVYPRTHLGLLSMLRARLSCFHAPPRVCRSHLLCPR